MQHETHSESPIHTPAKTSGSVVLWAAVIAAISFSIAQRLMLDFRAGHMDEYGYLFVGRNFLHGLEWPSYTYIFGANFNWYLFGAADKWLGGLTGARILSALLGFVSLGGVYLLGMALWNSRPIALCATLLLAVHSNHIFTSKIATYDSVSFTLFTLSLAALSYGARKPSYPSLRFPQIPLLITGSLLMLFAVLGKYTTAAYLPLVAVALLISSHSAFGLFCSIVGIGLAIHCTLHWPDLKVLYEIQIQGVHEANSTYTDIVKRSLQHTWLLLLPTMTAILYARTISAENRRHQYYLLCGLLLFSTPLVLYHLQGRNLISLYKHLNYANLFLALATAWLIVLVANANQWQASGLLRYRSTLLTIGMAVYLVFNFSTLRNTERGYPDLSGLSRYLASHDINGSVLSENPYFFRYVKFGELPQDQIRETSWLDNDNDGLHTHQDVKDAIWDHKFNYVLLTDAIHPKENENLREILDQRGYILRFHDEYLLSTVMTMNRRGHISLYERRQTANYVMEK